MYKLASTQLWVRDQDEALAFYTERLGMEVREDVTVVELGDFRWLTVGPRSQPDVAITLMPVPGEPLMDDATRSQLLELTSRGFTGTLFLTTDDIGSSYRELRERGIEFAQEPQEMPYGIDTYFQDPSGNSIRLAQLREFAAV